MDQRVDSERRSDSERDGTTPATRNGDTGKSSGKTGGTLRKRRGLILALVIGGIVLAIATVLWWLNARQYESTDDAFIDARTVQISAQVAAAIVDVPVTDNQLVEAGTELVRLDDRDYIAQRDQAQASINNFAAQIVEQKAKIAQAEKQVAQAQASLTFAQQQADRYQTLAKQGSGTVEQAQQYSSNLLQSQAALAAAQANATAVEKEEPVLEAQLKNAQAQLAQAEANLSRTIITAPVAGRVTRLTAAKGAYAAVGQALMMFVPRDIWLTANFKETQLDHMRPGQPVEIFIDAYPDRTFKGHVDSVQSGSGTAFSLLPAENATGNYVKIVQRVPVKIVFDTPPDVQLGPGMSVVPTVKVR
ncbi:MAG TPA: HlyD family secretion protein [Xanthobacteraceae bacterium]|jgi:membrane fusion protein (multidrug efflux system)|nr:HlyD family secretion protein [Xanthobacteraceae bacterium]